jgi:hypothetical protein
MKYGVTVLPDSICVAVHQHLAHILKHGATAHIHRAQLLQQKKKFNQWSGSRKNSYVTSWGLPEPDLLALNPFRR